jgi:hypothetical protein
MQKYAWAHIDEGGEFDYEGLTILTATTFVVYDDTYGYQIPAWLRDLAHIAGNMELTRLNEEENT